VQLTFHADDKKPIDGLQCIKMEPDIDYFKDLAAHALLEVVSNAISGSLTDPRQVYVLRWIAGRHAGVPEFNPLTSSPRKLRNSAIGFKTATATA